jgi:hypothetical protein
MASDISLAIDNDKHQPRSAGATPRGESIAFSDCLLAPAWLQLSEFCKKKAHGSVLSVGSSWSAKSVRYVA